MKSCSSQLSEKADEVMGVLDQQQTQDWEEQEKEEED